MEHMDLSVLKKSQCRDDPETRLGLDDDVRELFKFEDDGTVEVCTWVSDVALKTF